MMLKMKYKFLNAPVQRQRTSKKDTKHVRSEKLDKAKQGKNATDHEIVSSCLLKRTDFLMLSK